MAAIFILCKLNISWDFHKYHICNTSSDQEIAISEYAKFNDPAMDFAKFITICKEMNATFLTISSASSQVNIF